MKNKTIILFASVLVATAASAQSDVDWKKFGLEDVAKVAECASRHMGSSASADVVATYWGPVVQYGQQCVSSYSIVDAQSKNRARTTLLSGISACQGRNYTNDSDPWVRRVGYATAVIAAKGMNDWSTGKNKLTEYVERTIACQ